ncbi:MAG TPA: acyl-CoA dehydrogenase family protein [Burkholderiales bacterium]|nr:acyl-CoA dehydrogenase family protein [Burkholderiales bacterium]
MTSRNDVRAMLVDSATRLMADQVDPKMLDAAKDDGWSAALWQVLEEVEFTRLGIPEEAGGAGGTLSDLAAVLRIAGRFAAPVPLAETAMLAAWMLASAGLPLPRGPLAAGPAGQEVVRARRDGGRWIVSGVLPRLPWARIAKRLVLLAETEQGGVVVSVDPARCDIRPGRNLAGEPRDGVILDEVIAEEAAFATNVTRSALRLRGALARTLLMAGALERTLELAVRYAQERTQFGRRIGQFQAIQQELARFAGEVAAAVAAALSAAGTMERGADVTLAVASAKIRTAEAARAGALIAHQVHGAIGVTDEYPLHHSTLRLWAWREEYGNEAEWAIALGGITQKRGADSLWVALTN